MAEHRPVFYETNLCMTCAECKTGEPWPCEFAPRAAAAPGSTVWHCLDHGHQWVGDGTEPDTFRWCSQCQAEEDPIRGAAVPATPTQGDTDG